MADGAGASRRPAGLAAPIDPRIAEGFAVDDADGVFEGTFADSFDLTVE